ncbi:MAG: TonB-dependent receptor [Bacteroidia bacterium]|nr:TonB-dependent receptor [Bacteroidia bacterium]
MEKKILGCILFILLGSGLASAQTIRGQVLEKSAGTKETPLIGANVVWLGSTSGTASDEQGYFSLPVSPGPTQLVVSYVGYQNDTIHVDGSGPLRIYLMASEELAEIVVENNSLDLEPLNSELITTKDLKKAACCNLSESFETNASVEVSATDAVSGTKRIQMLGLDGIYAQVMTEGIHNLKGLASRSGLNFIPGTWIKSIDINKGSGSVVNGYESITGQINVQLARPESSEKWLLNSYLNQNGRIEANLNTAQALSDKWYTGLLLHASNLSLKGDANDDNFLDVPRYTQFNGVNRWKYKGDFFESEFGLKALYDDRLGGEVDFKKDQPRNVNQPYGYRTLTRRGEVFGKLGFISQKTRPGV